MSVLTTTQPVFDENYFHNVGKAARALWAALVAVKPRRATAPDASDGMLLGRRYEAVMPNLADELRFMASRG